MLRSPGEAHRKLKSEHGGLKSRGSHPACPLGSEILGRVGTGPPLGVAWSHSPSGTPKGERVALCPSALCPSAAGLRVLLLGGACRMPSFLFELGG